MYDDCPGRGHTHEGGAARFCWAGGVVTIFVFVSVLFEVYKITSPNDAVLRTYPYEVTHGCTQEARLRNR